MAIGKSSIKRAASVKEKTEEVREVEKETPTKKSEVISRIKSDLPIHLL